MWWNMSELFKTWSIPVPYVEYSPVTVHTGILRGNSNFQSWWCFQAGRGFFQRTVQEDFDSIRHLGQSKRYYIFNVLNFTPGLKILLRQRYFLVCSQQCIPVSQKEAVFWKGLRLRIRNYKFRFRILPGGSFRIRILPTGLFRSGSLSVKFSRNFHSRNVHLKVIFVLKSNFLCLK